MKLEVGKFYKTRDGLKAAVYSLGGKKNTNAEVLGARLLGDDWQVDTWHISGKYMEGDVDFRDIVSELKDPPLRAWHQPFTLLIEFLPSSMERQEPWIRMPWLDQPASTPVGESGNSQSTISKSENLGIGKGGGVVAGTYAKDGDNYCIAISKQYLATAWDGLISNLNYQGCSHGLTQARNSKSFEFLWSALSASARMNDEQAKNGK